VNRDDIIKMGQEAGWEMGDDLSCGFGVLLEKFAALATAAERNRTWTQDHWTEYERSIAAAEREACAKVCEEIPLDANPIALTHLPTIERCAAAIRARDKK
jgi:hypothetical protein